MKIYVILFILFHCAQFSFTRRIADVCINEYFFDHVNGETFDNIDDFNSKDSMRRFSRRVLQYGLNPLINDCIPPGSNFNGYKNTPIKALNQNRDLQYHGTTTLAVIYRDSVIICVDSKASMGTYIGSRAVKKILPITNTVVGTMAGGAADCSYWIRQVALEAKIYAFKYATTMGVQAIAKILALKLRERRGQELSVGTMIAGYDIPTSSPLLYYVDSEGSCVQGSMFCVGSGSPLAYSIMDELIKNSSSKTYESSTFQGIPSKGRLDSAGLNDLSLDAIIDKVAWAVRHATYRDGYSGGYINVVQVNSTGIHPLKRIDCRELKLGYHRSII